MRFAIVDLSGDPAWSEVARRLAAFHVKLDAEPAAFALTSAPDGGEILVVDSRGHYERGLDVMAQMASRSTTSHMRVLVTEFELPAYHQRAYLAGTTRVVVLSRDDGDVASVLNSLLQGET